MGDEDLKFDKESLALITKGLNSAISELKDGGEGDRRIAGKRLRVRCR